MKPYGLVWDYGQFEPKRNSVDQKLQRANALRAQKKAARREAKEEIQDQLNQMDVETKCPFNPYDRNLRIALTPQEVELLKRKPAPLVVMVSGIIMEEW